MQALQLGEAVVRVDEGWGDDCLDFKALLAMLLGLQFIYVVAASFGVLDRPFAMPFLDSWFDLLSLDSRSVL